MSDATLRTRSAAALFAGVAASAMGYTMMVAVIPLAAEDLLGSPRWSGAPSAMATTGIAVGTTWLAALMVRRGQRPALALGYWGAAAAACVAAIGAMAGAFPLVALAVFFVGAGYSASRLSRYVAAELFDPARRSAAIGWNVWAATVGSVAGPLLLDATRRLGGRVGLPDVGGPFLMAALSFVVSALVIRWRFVSAPHPAYRSSAGGVADQPGSPAGLRLAIASLIIGQVVMVLIMTMTPVHIRHGGSGLDWVGIVFASHTLGMFAFSPVAGILSDRLGRRPMIATACAVLAASGWLAAESPPGSWQLATALFLLGLGWCFSFVAGSALLTESVPLLRRVRAQGLADSMVWGSAAMAGLSSGLLLSTVGYATLSRVGMALAVVPLIFLWRTDARPARSPDPAGSA